MIKIILADKQSIFRAGVARVLSMESDCRIVAQCADKQCLQSALVTFRGAVVLFGSSMKNDCSLLMQQISGLGSRGIAILETGELPEPYLNTHVHGLFFRSITGPALVDCVRRVSTGERVLHFVREAPLVLEGDLIGARVRDRLTAKEMKILALIIQGCKNKEIASRLGTTEQVIKNYLGGVYDKTGVSDRLELALFTMHHRSLAEAATAAGSLISSVN